jgi:hypothetical protein
MVSLLQKLEVRQILPREVMFKELDEPMEFYFIQQGKYDIGYEINKIVRYRLQFGPRTLVGAFNVMFSKRFNFQYKARTLIHCLALRRKNWETLVDRFEYFSECMKIVVMYNYSQHVRRPMIIKKKNDVK